MSSPVISVRNLGKKYQLGATLAHDTLRDHLAHATKRALGLFRPPPSALPTPHSDDFWALKDVSFDVQQGEVVGIIGRNGAGKSTLLKILSQITEPTEGEIKIRGRVASLLEVGTGFHPELSGRENVFLNGAILGMTQAEIRKKFDEIVAFSEVEKFLETPVKRYSSGMYVRLAFAVAAHLDPEILIIDEVLAVGDAAFQQKCLGKMDDVAHQGRTVLFVSHAESSIRRLCSRAILLRSGTVACDGTPSDAYGKYRMAGCRAGFSVAGRTRSSAHFQITNASLLLNRRPVDSMFLGDKPVLNLQINVVVPAKLSVEVVLRDANSSPIMFAPTGLEQGFKPLFVPGKYSLSFQLEFPKLAEGRYSLDFLLVEPGIQTYDQLEEALFFEVLPTHNALTGWRFRQATGQGSILLEAGVPVISDSNL